MASTHRSSTLPPSGASAISSHRLTGLTAAITALPDAGDKSDGRSIAGLIDGAVRVARTQPQGLATIAARLHALLTAEPRPRVEFEATRLKVNGHVAMEADLERGRWLLLAFMSGLREVEATADCRGEEVIAFAQELAALRPNPTLLEQFADWLWSDGLEGFTVGLHVSFAEILDVADDPERRKNQIAALRTEMAMALSSDHLATVRDLDRAALLPEFQAPLDAYTAALQGRQVGLTSDEAALLRAECDAAAFWVRQEIVLALANPSLRRAITPAAIARGLVRVAAVSFERDFLGLVSMLSQSQDGFAREVLVALEQQPVGMAIADRAPLDSVGLQRLLQLLKGATPKLAEGIARGLCERAGREASELNPVGQLVQAMGFAAFVALFDPATLSQPGRDILTRIGVMLRAEGSVLAPVAEGCSPALALLLLPKVAPADRAFFRGLVERQLSATRLRDRTQLVATLTELRWPDLAELTFEAFRASSGAGWELRATRLMTEASAASGKGERLLSMQRDAAIPMPIRLVLMDALASVPSTADEVLKRKLTEFLEPQEIKDKLAELRARRQG